MELYKDEKINGADQEYEDNLYTAAHNQFMTNVDVIEKENPHIMDDDSDSDLWYDEYREDVITEYCDRLNKFMSKNK